MKRQQIKSKNALDLLTLPKRKLPKAWVQAAGLLKHKKIDGLAYQKKIRSEWNGYLERQIRLAKGGE